MRKPENRRSENMRAVPNKNSTPEIVVRKALHRLGYRFRLHKKDIPGKPDIVLRKHNTCIFVHGCFWHRHHNCKRATTPKTNTEFWQEKFSKNVDRDRRTEQALTAMGWTVVIIWECETKNMDELLAQLTSVLPPPR